ncbi:MAG: sigma-54-dependent Fis family transcriptional regulator [Magnetococcales bacterium]|nr:sigma-54-dependent Fis family transcriptional regulator [Magnetococcales bacterium]
MTADADLDNHPSFRMGTILVLDDELRMRQFFEQFLSGLGHRVVCADGMDAAMKAIAEVRFDLIFSDIMLGGKSGLTFLQEIKNQGVDCPVIMITGYPTLQTATEALRLGAYDYLVKPIRIDPLERMTHQALRHRFLHQENVRMEKNLQAIFRSVQDAILLIDARGRLQEVNQAAAKVCQLDIRAAVDRPFHELLRACSRGCLEAVEATLATGRTVQRERIECVMQSGPVQVNEVMTTPVFHPDGSVCACVLVVRNQTHLVNLEHSLEARHRFHRLIGRNPGMLKIYGLIELLGAVHTTVLITGESGTGKELVAEAIHRQRSDWKMVPMIKVNCSALSEHLLESELFGHVKGAFTGAIKDKVGRFEMANSGTLFLDEIGDISIRLQLKLLRVIQEREFERVGDSTTIQADFRLIVATNQDLDRKVGDGTFREDLFHRLNVVNLHLPSLRRRVEDIPLLVEHFIDKFNHLLNKKVTKISANALKILMNHSWPGNVRELENTMEHACLLCHGATLYSSHLPTGRLKNNENREYYVSNEVMEQQREALQSGESVITPTERARTILMEKMVHPFPGPVELLQALTSARWNKTKAAQLLGISRRTLYRLMDKMRE